MSGLIKKLDEIHWAEEKGHHSVGTYPEKWGREAGLNFIDFDFKQLYGSPLNFINCIFPYEVLFKKCNIQKELVFHMCKFTAPLEFLNCQFETNLTFQGSKFFEGVRFNPETSNLTPKKPLYDKRTEFKGELKFSTCEFSKDVVINRINFCENVEFKNITFFSNAFFEKVTFEKDFNFLQVETRGWGKLVDVYFQQQALFDGTDFKRLFMFENVNFEIVPGFTQTKFDHLLRLDNLDIPTDIRSYIQRGLSREEVASRYRALKSMAIQAKDHEKELEFFAYELQAKGSWWAKAYGAFSDYGRSFMRPFIGWGVCGGLGFLLYSLIIGTPHHHAAKAALVSNFPLVGYSRFVEGSIKCVGNSLSGFGWLFLTVQNVLALIFIFLMALALRNKFKLKKKAPAAYGYGGSLRGKT